MGASDRRSGNNGRPYLGGTSETPDNHQLAQQLAVLKERMNTMQADLSATLERFRANVARRETRMLLAMAAMIGLAVAVLGFLV